MSGLARLQESLQARILHGSRAIDAAVDAADPEECQRRLHIYEHAYLVRLVDGLGDTYRALRTTLGAAEFNRVAGGFARAVPSVHRSIRDYGAELADHIAGRIDGIEGRTLAELARWEWLLASVFDAADACVLTIPELAAVPPDRWAALRFAPHPSLRRFTSTTNAIELWRIATGAAAADDGQDLPRESCESPLAAGTRPAASACTLRPAVDWLAWRSDLKTMYRSIPSDEACAIDALLERAAFGDICEMLASAGDPQPAPLRAAQLLRGWVEAGLLSAIS